MSKFLFASLALLAGLASGGAHATITIYTSQSAYLAAITASAVDSFDDLDYTAPISGPMSRTADTYTYDTSVGPNDARFYAATDDGSDVWLSTLNRRDTVTFSGFSSGVQGVGGYFFSSDANGFSTTTPATLTVTATDSSGTVTSSLVNPTATSFVGFVTTDAFSAVQVWVGTAGTGTLGVWPTINDLTLGKAAAVTVVPEPATTALLLGGLALVTARARRRQA